MARTFFSNSAPRTLSLLLSPFRSPPPPPPSLPGVPPREEVRSPPPPSPPARAPPPPAGLPKVPPHPPETAPLAGSRFPATRPNAGCGWSSASPAGSPLASSLRAGRMIRAASSCLAAGSLISPAASRPEVCVLRSEQGERMNYHLNASKVFPWSDFFGRCRPPCFFRSCGHQQGRQHPCSR